MRKKPALLDGTAFLKKVARRIALLEGDLAGRRRDTSFD
jgi:hypothetical protein